jgi:hypothetical protein
VKLTVVKGGADPALARVATEIRQAVVQGADVRFHRLALQQMEVLGLEDTDIRAMLATCRVIRAEPTAVLEPPLYIACGDRLEHSTEAKRRVQKEFAIKVSVDITRRPKKLGVFTLWQLEERG